MCLHDSQHLRVLKVVLDHRVLVHNQRFLGVAFLRFLRRRYSGGGLHARVNSGNTARSGDFPGVDWLWCVLLGGK